MTEQEQFYYLQNQQAINKKFKKQQRNDIVKTGFGLGATLITCLIIQTILVMIIQLTGKIDLYYHSAIFGSCFNIIAVHICSMLFPFLFAALIFKRNFVSPLIPVKEFDTKIEPVCWVLMGLGWCCIGDIVTGVVMKLVESLTDYKLTQGELADPDSTLACIIAVLATAIVPGIVEEICFRGSALGILRKYGKGFAVFAVSIAFGLLHGNVIQFIFAFTIGLCLGYITIKTDNILPAMFIHGFNNGMSVIKDIATYYASEKTGDVITNIAFYLFIIFGILGFLYLLKNKKLKPEKKVKTPWDNNFITKLLCLVPGLFLPFMFLIYSTIQTIVKQ